MAGEPTKNYQTGSQHRSKICPKRPLGGVLGGLLEGLGWCFGSSWGVLGRLEDVLGGSWPQDGPKSSKCSKNQRSLSPFGGHVGAQNRSKFVPRSIQKVIIFLSIFDIHFLRFLDRFWSQLGPILASKIGPRGAQEPSKMP